MPDSALITGQGSITGELALLAFSSPSVFDALTICMAIQPEFDPDAGTGAILPVQLFLALDLTIDEADALLTLVNNDSYKLYLVLRASSFSYWLIDEKRNEFKEWLAAGVLDIQALVTHVRVFLPEFGLAKFGGNDGDTKKARGKRAQSSKPRRSNPRSTTGRRGSSKA